MDTTVTLTTVIEGTLAAAVVAGSAAAVAIASVMLVYVLEAALDGGFETNIYRLFG